MNNKKKKKYTIEDEKLGKIEVEEIPISSKKLVFDPKKGMVWVDTHVLEAQKPIIDLLKKGDAYRLAGNLNTAIQCYVQVLNIDPKNIAAKNNLGMILSDVGQFREAEKLFLEILVVDPESVPTINCISAMYIRQQKYQKAKSYAEKAIKLAPDNEHSINNWINVMKSLRMCDELIAYVNEILSGNKLTHPDKITFAYYSLANCYRYIKRNDDAIQACEMGLEIAHKYNHVQSLAFLTYELGLTLLEEKKYAELKEAGERVIARVRNHPGVLEVLGDAYYQLKEYKKALQCY